MAALHAMISLSKADTAAIVPQNRVPALVVMGSRDPDFEDAAAEARWLAGQLGAESLIVEGAGHYPHTEMPDRVAPKLLAFIAKAHGRPSRTTLNGKREIPPNPCLAAFQQVAFSRYPVG